MKTVAAVILVVLVLMASSASAEYDPKGFMVAFELSTSPGLIVSIGAFDGGSSFATLPPDGLQIRDGYSLKIHQGAAMSFTEYLDIVPPSTESCFLSWTTFNWDQSLSSWKAGDIVEKYDVVGHLFAPSVLMDVDLTKPGQIALKDVDYTMGVMVNPVPEPASLLAIGAGMIGLLGRGKIRRRR
jgi:hypothetical protein